MSRLVNVSGRAAIFHLFEPQPSMQLNLRNSVANMRRFGHTVHINQAAAYTRNGTMAFYVPRLKSASEMASLHSKIGNGRHIRHNITIATMDFDEYLETALTSATRGDNQPIGFLKMDIESAEFDVLPHLLRRVGGPACRVSFWLIEWHLWASANLTPEKCRLRRTFDAQLAELCAGMPLPRGAPRVIDHDERLSSGVDLSCPKDPSDSTGKLASG